MQIGRYMAGWTAMVVALAASAQAPPASSSGSPRDRGIRPGVAGTGVRPDIAWGPRTNVQAGLALVGRYGGKDQHTGLYVFGVYIRNTTKRPLPVVCPSFDGLSVPSDRVSYTTLVQSDRIYCTPHMVGPGGKAVAILTQPGTDLRRYELLPGQVAMVSHWMLRTLPKDLRDVPGGPSGYAREYTQVAFVAPGRYRMVCDVGAQWGEVGGRLPTPRTGQVAFEVTEADLARR